MARINLLPWRENLRKKRQRNFGIAAFVAVLVTAAGCGGAYLYIDGMIKHQNKRNNYLKQEIALVEKKIREIQEIERTKARLIARMNVIQELQGSRPEIVHLFDELITTIPDGVFLTSLKQSGRSLTMKGRAQSNARVSTYMRNIDASKWLSVPNLEIISSKSKGKGGVDEISSFDLKAKQVTPKPAKKSGR
ncbi:PilN domain-containing protein [Solemya velesiana gill symbiont]|uniref:Pilus assembly protein PilN n=1 Tax=Solemya velesiana gill symbiont TaxID=1918948 RepID=A0A1T2KYB0_9GAMM|nr:PilN domain-containing protein [Solemya velesiana gill symbiont]OOZ37848.1 pilus assembly protein PilN [Solemya velesiana gill symbiont]